MTPERLKEQVATQTARIAELEGELSNEQDVVLALCLQVERLAAEAIAAEDDRDRLRTRVAELKGALEHIVSQAYQLTEEDTDGPQFLKSIALAALASGKGEP